MSQKLERREKGTGTVYQDKNGIWRGKLRYSFSLIHKSTDCEFDTTFHHACFPTALCYEEGCDRWSRFLQIAS